MGSQGQDLMQQAGQTLGHAEVKEDELIGQASNAAHATENKVLEATQSVKSSSNETTEQASSFLQQVKKDELIGPASNATHATENKESEAAQSAQRSSNETTEQASSFLQQIGEQMKNIAQGTAEAVKNTTEGATKAVKNTLGMNSFSNNNNSNN